MSAHQKRKEALFEAARQLDSPSERTAYLEKSCGDDPELRRHVEAMLDAEEEADQYFRAADSPGNSYRDEAMHGPGALAEPPAEGPGTVIGRYQLLERIGEGGFGAVYLAQQREPVVRKVALKIIKLGMDTKQVVARFEAERQALALMDHPHIAKVLDAGATETGRPYFVMELVEGIPITAYCDKNNLTPAERLRLLLPVCQAIQHAHQKGIIHRDIKPSNVLVTLNEGVPQPMVIDFGVAKALNQRLTEKTLYTSFGQMIGTPAYMSPEQADVRSAQAGDVDTRSDVYSLGVLLYELLTGTTPFTEQQLRETGWAEMQRIIAEEEPPRPSTRLNAMSETERAGIARRRQSDARRLVLQVRGELDWIAMKALEKDRTRRYDTVNELALDIQNYLSDLPVTAMAPSAGYRMAKFIKRHRAGLGVTAVLIAVMAAGLMVSCWQMLRARQAERLAEQRLLEVEKERKRNEIGTNSYYSIIGGGYDNYIADDSEYAVIPGGRDNQAAASYTFAAGRQAKANHAGSFVWSDSADLSFSSVTNNEFAVRAAGGVRLETGQAGLKVNGLVGIGNGAPIWPIDVEADRAVARLVTSRSISGSTIEFRNDTHPAEDLGEINFNNRDNKYPGQIAYKATDSMTFQTARAERLRIDGLGRVGMGTNNPAYPLHMASGAHCTVGGAWVNESDCNRKENFERVDGRAVLEQVARLPITRWNYKAEDKTVRHLGPMAQDFNTAFTVGESDTAIATVDADGVALAAIQGLNEKVEAENRQLREALDAKTGELDTVKQRLADFEQLLSKLTRQVD